MKIGIIAAEYIIYIIFMDFWKIIKNFRVDLTEVVHNNLLKRLSSINLSEGVMNVLILQCCVFFFVSVYTRTYQNNASISNFGGGFRYQNESSWCIGRSFFEFPNIILKDVVKLYYENIKDKNINYLKHKDNFKKYK
ncbi:Uncharacterized protein FWK35_00014603 [Aphis craccivora]|uniref:Uncharacterized protein n=1 Tax=Aphis craccivora TaxID=307492 RepID=A0A6G0YJ00_APHCR|nr:Uncharacterized protein FWK35_00014603 [Aphis craccivora]